MNIVRKVNNCLKTSIKNDKIAGNSKNANSTDNKHPNINSLRIIFKKHRFSEKALKA